MQFNNYKIIIEYESNLKKIDDLWNDFTFERSMNLYDLFKQ